MLPTTEDMILYHIPQTRRGECGASLLEQTLKHSLHLLLCVVYVQLHFLMEKLSVLSNSEKALLNKPGHIKHFLGPSKRFSCWI